MNPFLKSHQPMLNAVHKATAILNHPNIKRMRETAIQLQNKPKIELIIIPKCIFRSQDVIVGDIED